MAVCNGCHVGVVDRRQRLNGLRCFHQSTNRALQAMFEQIGASSISGEDENLLLALDINMPSLHNNYFSDVFSHETKLIHLVHASQTRPSRSS